MSNLLVCATLELKRKLMSIPSNCRKKERKLISDKSSQLVEEFLEDNT